MRHKHVESRVQRGVFDTQVDSWSSRYPAFHLLGEMTYESLGAVGSAPSLDGRAIAELELGIAFLRLYVGEPPEGSSLEIREHDHDLGQYATIALCGRSDTLEPDEWRYYHRCEGALFKLNGAVDWRELAEVLLEDEEDEPLEQDETDG